MTPEQQRFRDHLEEASRIVATWPEWKRNCLGNRSTNEHPRCPVDNRYERERDFILANPTFITTIRHPLQSATTVIDTGVYQ